MSTGSSSLPSAPHDNADPKPTLEQLFHVLYSIQTSLMRNLNVYDFRNLQSAGCQVLASPAIQSKHLLSIQCNEFRRMADSTSACGNTPQEVEMKPCLGYSWSPDDGFRAPGNPSRTGHLHDGYDQSINFWVCEECRHRNIEYYHDVTASQIFYRRLCEVHSRELRMRPYNDCRCHVAAIEDWRCTTCTIGNAIMLMERVNKSYFTASLLVTVFGFWTLIIRPHLNWANWLIWGLIRLQNFLNTTVTPWDVLLSLGIQRREWQFVKQAKLCPIEGCKRGAWKHPRVMQMCLECKVFLPTDRFRVRLHP